MVVGECAVLDASITGLSVFEGALWTRLGPNPPCLPTFRPWPGFGGRKEGEPIYHWRDYELGVDRERVSTKLELGGSIGIGFTTPKK